MDLADTPPSSPPRATSSPPALTPPIAMEPSAPPPPAPRPPAGEVETRIMETAALGGLSPAAELYDHQYENVVRFAREHTLGLRDRREPYGIIVADAPGLGKTLSALAMAAAARALSGLPWVLICAPVAVLDHWVAQAGRWCPGLEALSWQRMSRQRRAAFDPASRPGGFIIVSPDALTIANADSAKSSLFATR